MHMYFQQHAAKKRSLEDEEAEKKKRVKTEVDMEVEDGMNGALQTYCIAYHNLCFPCPNKDYLSV